MARITEGTAERQLFKIGAVARLTGVSVHTLRKWEERHDAVRPRRSQGGKRLYTDADVQRLVLIKRLVDHGLSLPGIASCSFDELADRWGRLVQSEGSAAAAGPVTVAVLGTGIATWLKTRDGRLAGMDVIAAADNVEDLSRRLGDSPVDVLAVEYPAVSRTTASEVHDLMESTGVSAAVIVYWYGDQAHLQALQSRQVEVLRAPVDPLELQQAIARIRGDGSAPLPETVEAAAALAAEPPPPRLSRESLARMAVAKPRASCGCQKNLVGVALSLRALEEYLDGCESRSAEDEALHRALNRKVGEARNSIEDAIEHFAKIEGIEL